MYSQPAASVVDLPFKFKTIHIRSFAGDIRPISPFRSSILGQVLYIVLSIGNSIQLEFFAGEFDLSMTSLKKRKSATDMPRGNTTDDRPNDRSHQRRYNFAKHYCSTPLETRRGPASA